jgi:hypothetical protein
MSGTKKGRDLVVVNRSHWPPKARAAHAGPHRRTHRSRRLISHADRCSVQPSSSHSIADLRESEPGAGGWRHASAHDKQGPWLVINVRPGSE